MPNLTNSDRESGTQETPVVSNPDVFKQALDEVLSELPTRKERTGEVMLRKASSARKPSHTLGVGFQPCPRSFSSSPQRAPHPGASDWANWIQRLCVAAMIGSAGFIVFLFLFGYSWSPVHQTETRRTVATFTATPRTKPIKDVEVGDRVAGRNPIREQAEGIEPDPATWRKISLYMTKDSGLGLWIDLLRPLDWIELTGAEQGATIYLDLDEFGAVGDAEVTYLGPCPYIKPGNGSVVTGKFTHQADNNSNVVRLKLEGQEELTGVTDNHAYWSVDRQDFVEVGKLRHGEVVDTEFGACRVVSIAPIKHTDFLYNLETTEHVYRVGSLGTLVHNSCADEISDTIGRGVHITNKTGAGAARPPRHHIFPQEHRQWFSDRGFDIDRVTVELDQGTHSALHTMKWNETLMRKLYAAEATAGHKLNAREIWDVGYGHMREFNLRDLRFLPFTD